MFIAGLVTPIITMTKFVLLENTFSVLSGALGLLKEGQFFLFVVITGFSVLLPLLKMAVLYKLLSAKQQASADLDRYLHWMHLFGKWSMLDVFVVAVLVVAVKLGAIASVEMRFGLYAFTAAVRTILLPPGCGSDVCQYASAPVRHCLFSASLKRYGHGVVYYLRGDEDQHAAAEIFGIPAETAAEFFSDQRAENRQRECYNACYHCEQPG